MTEFPVQGPAELAVGGAFACVPAVATRAWESPMVDLDLYLAFIAATSVLMLIPGPNVALIVANSVAYGSRYGFLTVAGTSSAMLPQLALAALGMTAALGAAAEWFEWIRWLGVLYL